MKEDTKKPNCRTEVYSRVTGYFQVVDRFNKGKKAEFHDRKKFDKSVKEVSRGKEREV